MWTSAAQHSTTSLSACNAAFCDVLFILHVPVYYIKHLLSLRFAPLAYQLEFVRDARGGRTSRGCPQKEWKHAVLHGREEKQKVSGGPSFGPGIFGPSDA